MLETVGRPSEASVTPWICPSHLLSEFIDTKDHVAATPAGLVFREAPSTLYAAAGTKVKVAVQSRRS